MKFSINERYDYQRGILNYLKEHNGYRVRTNENFDRRFAIDGELLVEFLTKTQPKKVELLRKMYKGDFEETLVQLLQPRSEQKGWEPYWRAQTRHRSCKPASGLDV